MRMRKLILFSILLGLAASIKAQIVLPWTEDFEKATGTTTYTSDADTIDGLYNVSYDGIGYSRIRLSAGSGFYHNGNHAATMDMELNTTSTTHRMYIELDLSLYRNSEDLVLSFYYMDHNDISDIGDCLRLKTGTSSEYKVYDFAPGSHTNGAWNYVELDLDALLSSNGLEPSEQTYLVFCHTGKSAASSTTFFSGITFDDISIIGSMPEALLPWNEGFEDVQDDMTIGSNKTSINGRGNMSYQKSYNGRIRFNAGSTYYHSGNRALTMDCDAYNSSLPQNMMVMTLNMERYVDYDDLELSFFYMHHGEAAHSWDNVYIRGSSSDTWVEAYDLYANQALAGIWKEVSGIDIDALLTAQGQTVSSTFQIAFSQQDDDVSYTKMMSAGITVDDISITCKDIYWVGKVNDEFANNLNWWPNIVPNESCDLNNLIICGDAQNNLVLDIYDAHDQAFEVNDFYIESEASFIINVFAGHPDSYVLCIKVFGDLQVDGTLDVLDSDALNLNDIIVYGDIVNNGLIGYDFNITFSGADKSFIRGTNTLNLEFLDINKTYLGFDAVELISDTDSMVCGNMDIFDGSFEINTDAVLSIGTLFIHDGACLNTNDPGVILIIKDRLKNYNTTTSSTLGLPSNSANTIYFDFESDTYNYLEFGDGTHLGTELFNVEFLNTIGDTNPVYELQSDMLVQNDLYLSGAIVNTGTHHVIIQNTSNDAIQTHGESSYIDGNLRRYVTTGTYDFPVGSSAYYQLVTIDIASVSGGLTYLDSKFTSTSSETPPSGLEVNGDEIAEFLDNGYWTVTPNAGSAEYDISLTSYGHTNGGEVAGQHAIFKRSGVGDWESLGTHDNSTQTGSGNDPITVKRSNLSGFSDFIIGKGELPYALPVELVSFNAKCYGEYVQLDWETASEKNNREFIIEKSFNSKDFYEIGSVPGCGNCNINSYYAYQYFNTSENVTYYRLKQIDYDGSVNYSAIVSSRCSESSIEISCSFELDKLIINLLGSTERYTFVLFDSSGKMIYEGKILDAGVNEFAIPDLSTGVYYLKLFNSYESYSHKLFYNNF